MFKNSFSVYDSRVQKNKTNLQFLLKWPLKQLFNDYITKTLYTEEEKGVKNSLPGDTIIFDFIRNEIEMK